MLQILVKRPASLSVFSLFQYACCGPDVYDVSEGAFKRVSLQETYLCCEFQACQGLAEMGLKRTDHDKHQRLRITTERGL